MQEIPALVGYLLVCFGDKNAGLGPTLRAWLLSGERSLSPVKKLLGFSEELRVIDDPAVRIDGKPT